VHPAKSLVLVSSLSMHGGGCTCASRLHAAALFQLVSPGTQEAANNCSNRALSTRQLRVNPCTKLTPVI